MEIWNGFRCRILVYVPPLCDILKLCGRGGLLMSSNKPRYKDKSEAALKRHEFEPLRKLMGELGIGFDTRRTIRDKIEKLYERKIHPNLKKKILAYYNQYSPPMINQPNTKREIAIADEMREFHRKCIEDVMRIVEGHARKK